MQQEQHLPELALHSVFLAAILLPPMEQQQELFPLAPLLQVFTSPGTISAVQGTDEAAFSFSQSYTQADAVPSAAVTLGAAPNFSSVTSYGAGVAGDLAGTVNSGGVLTVTAGGAGSTAIGQFVSEITVID